MVVYGYEERRESGWVWLMKVENLDGMENWSKWIDIEFERMYLCFFLVWMAARVWEGYYG